MDLKNIAASVTPEVNEVMDHLHRHPEVGLEESATSAYIEEKLRTGTKLDRIQRVAQTGILAELKGAKPGPSIMLRGDMDALPITEDDSHAVKSEHKGVMHACGHDVHTSILYGAIKALEPYRDQIAGSVLFAFQPAEEILKGALQFLGDPAVDLSNVKGVAACHVSAELTAGTIGMKKGPVLASSDILTIKVTGKNGHAAYPHAAVDSIVAASNIVVALQSLVSRETAPTDSAVLSICTIRGGTAFNIIASEVILEGTLRTVHPDTRKRMHAAIERVCKNVAAALGATAELTIEVGPPPFLNDAEWADRTIRVGEKLLGKENVIIPEAPSLAAEDFTYFREKIPGVFINLGARAPGGPYTPVHTPQFICDRSALPVGVATLAGIALDFFGIDY